MLISLIPNILNTQPHISPNMASSPKNKIKCHHLNQCRTASCPYKHTNPFCQFDTHCCDPSCPKRHSKIFCYNGVECYTETCQYRHLVYKCRYFHNCPNKKNCDYRHARSSNVHTHAAARPTPSAIRDVPVLEAMTMHCKQLAEIKQKIARLEAKVKRR